MNEELKKLGDIMNNRMVSRDQDGNVMMRVAQIATVYFADPHARDTRERVTACCEAYLERWGDRIRWALDPETRLMVPLAGGKAPHPRAWLPHRAEDEGFSLLYHDAEHERGAGMHYLAALGEEQLPRFTLGYLTMALPAIPTADTWTVLPELLLHVCRVMKPVSGYGGLGIMMSPDRSIAYRWAHLIGEWAEAYPGIEVDYPISHANWLCEGREGGRDGIKGVNWLTAVGDRYLPELGGADKVAADVAALDSGFVIHRYEGGLLIQAGPRPNLGYVKSNLWPALYIKLAKYLKPIRITSTAPFQRVGPDVYFDRERSEAWLRRFDDREV